MFAPMVAPVLGFALVFTAPAPVVSYDFNGAEVTHGTVHNGEVLMHGGKAYKAVSVNHKGTLTYFRTVPSIPGNQEVTFYPR